MIIESNNKTLRNSRRCARHIIHGKQTAAFSVYVCVCVCLSLIRTSKPLCSHFALAALYIHARVLVCVCVASSQNIHAESAPKPSLNYWNCLLSCCSRAVARGRHRTLRECTTYVYNKPMISTSEHFVSVRL